MYIVIYRYSCKTYMISHCNNIGVTSESEKNIYHLFILYIEINYSFFAYHVIISSI